MSISVKFRAAIQDGGYITAKGVKLSIRNHVLTVESEAALQEIKNLVALGTFGFYEMSKEEEEGEGEGEFVKNPALTPAALQELLKLKPKSKSKQPL